MSVIQKGVPYIFNGDQVIAFKSATEVKSIQGYQDLPSMESWYKEDPTNNHLGMQKFFGNQQFTPQGLFPELLERKAVLEVNGFGGSFTYDVPITKSKGCYTTRDFSHQVKPGIDDSTFKIALNREFTTGDILTNDAEFGQQISVTADPVIQVGDSYEHTVTLVSNDKTAWFLANNLRKGITFYKLNHAIQGEYGTNYSHIDMPDTVGSMTCEFTLGDMRGVEAYVTGVADKKSFSGAAASTKDYLQKLEQQVAKMGELAVMMDVDKSTGKTIPSSARIGATMQFLVMKELERLTAQALLFQRAGTIRNSNGVTRLNEGLWHQLRRGKLIKYSRPGGLTRTHIKEAVEYVFRVNPHLQDIERRVKFKCGSEAYDNILQIFSDEVNAQLANVSQFMGSDRSIPNPIQGNDLMNLEMKPVRFTKVFIPGIGNMEIERDTNLDYSIMQDRFAAGFHGYQRAHTTYSMIIWDAEDQMYSNNADLPKGSSVIEGGSTDSNVYLVKPQGEMTYWGYSNGRYSISKASDIVSSYKQIGQEFWAWNSCAIWVRDITKFVMIELDESARKGFQ